MRCVAGAARAGGGGLLDAEDALHLAELGVRVLERRSTLHDHVDADAVADRHLIDEPAEVPLELGDARGELVAPPLQVNGALGSRVELPGGQAAALARGSFQSPHWPKKSPVNLPFL